MTLELPHFINNLTEKGVKFSVEGGRLMCDAPQGIIDKVMAERIRDNKQGIIDLVIERNNSANIIPYSDTDIDLSDIPMTQSQERLLFLEYLMKGAFAANLPLTLKLSGPIDIAAFKSSLQMIVDRHSILRTTFTLEGERPCQTIHPSCLVDINIIDYSDRECTQIKEYEDFIKNEIGKPFNFGVLNLFKFFIFKLSVDEHIFFFVKPSIIWDGWSYDIFINELNLIYSAISKGQPSPLHKLRIQYSDYSIWHRKWVDGYEVNKQIDYWKKKLPSRLPKMKLPFDRKRPSHFIYKGGHEFVRISDEDIEQLKALCKQDNLTLFIGFLTVLNILLFRYTDNKDILIGMPMWNRVRPETEDLIGHFVNNVLLLTKIRPESSFRQAMRDVQTNFIDAFNNQEAPFEKLVEQLNLIQGQSRDPIYQVFFSYQDARNRSSKIGDLVVKQLDSHNSSVSNDLSFWLKESETDIVGAIDYSSDLFDEETIKRFLNHFTVLLKSCLKNPDECIHKLEILTDTDTSIYKPWIVTNIDNKPGIGISQLYKKNTLNDPSRIAIQTVDKTISYGDLDTRTDIIAMGLRANGVDRHHCVGILMDRSVDAVAAILGILKSNCGFVLFCPEDPPERIYQQMSEIKPALVLIQPHHKHIVEGIGIRAVDIDTIIRDFSGSDLIDDVSEDSTACFVYTPSSDGTVSYVPLTHKVVIDRVRGIQEKIGISPDDKYYCDHVISRGDGGIAFLMPLLWGGLLVLGGTADNDTLPHIIESYNPLIIHTCSERMNILKGESLHSAVKIMYSGKICSGKHISELSESCSGIWYMFGYPETSFWSGYFHTKENANDTLRINGSIGSSQFLILDSQKNLMPVGATGTLYIDEPGIDKEYLIKPIHSHDVDSPISGMVFNTGDRARYLNDGTIEIIETYNVYHRVCNDRISLKEIENCINQHPSVNNSAVIVISESDSIQRLIGFYVLDEVQKLDICELEMFLSNKLPGFMIPDTFVYLNALPLLEDLSVDKDSLTYGFTQSVTTGKNILEPSTETEKALTEIWKQVLNINRIGINQVFFDLGGHSLLAVGLFAKINKKFDIDLPLALLFSTPTIKGLASRIDAERYIIHQQTIDDKKSDENEDFEI